VKKNLSRLRAWADLHDQKRHKSVILICLAGLILLSLLARKSLIDFKNPDYQTFSAWYDFIKSHGIHSFKYDAAQGFSVYNPPYTYFLYLASLLPVSKLVAIKGILALFDVFLAVSVYFVVKLFRPHGYIPIIAAISTMFLPTVLVTGVMWGQFDQLYVGSFLLSLYFGLKNNSKWAWIWFGLAIAVKLQAIFFLPVLIIMCFKRIRWYDAVWGAGAFLVVTLPPMLAGRSLGSLLSIYPNQINLFNGNLVLNAPTLYQWFPNSVFPYFNHMATALAIAAAITLLLVSLLYKKFSNKDILLVTSLCLYLIPFLLPAMHERYFFPAGIGSLVLAFAYPSRLYAGIALLMQAITLFSYCPFLFNTVPVPFYILSLGVLLIIYLLASQYLSLQTTKSDQAA
jgi:Gpi18-like mannosyltransferase